MIPLKAIVYLLLLKVVLAIYYDRAHLPEFYKRRVALRPIVPRGHRYLIYPKNRLYVVESGNGLVAHRNLSAVRYWQDKNRVRPHFPRPVLIQRPIPANCKVISESPRICGGGLAEDVNILVEPFLTGRENGIYRKSARFFCSELEDPRPCVATRPERRREKELLMVHVYIIDAGATDPPPPPPPPPSREPATEQPPRKRPSTERPSTERPSTERPYTEHPNSNAVLSYTRGVPTIKVITANGQDSSEISPYTVNVQMHRSTTTERVTTPKPEGELLVTYFSGLGTDPPPKENEVEVSTSTHRETTAPVAVFNMSTLPNYHVQVSVGDQTKHDSISMQREKDRFNSSKTHAKHVTVDGIEVEGVTQQPSSTTRMSFQVLTMTMPSILGQHVLVSDRINSKVHDGLSISSGKAGQPIQLVSIPPTIHMLGNKPQFNKAKSLRLGPKGESIARGILRGYTPQLDEDDDYHSDTEAAEEEEKTESPVQEDEYQEETTTEYILDHTDAEDGNGTKPPETRIGDAIEQQTITEENVGQTDANLDQSTDEGQTETPGQMVEGETAQEEPIIDYSSDATTAEAQVVTEAPIKSEENAFRDASAQEGTTAEVNLGQTDVTSSDLTQEEAARDGANSDGGYQTEPAESNTEGEAQTETIQDETTTGDTLRAKNENKTELPSEATGAPSTELAQETTAGDNLDQSSPKSDQSETPLPSQDEKVRIGGSTPRKIAPKPSPLNSKGKAKKLKPMNKSNKSHAGGVLPAWHAAGAATNATQASKAKSKQLNGSGRKIVEEEPQRQLAKLACSNGDSLYYYGDKSDELKEAIAALKPFQQVNLTQLGLRASDLFRHNDIPLSDDDYNTLSKCRLAGHGIEATRDGDTFDNPSTIHDLVNVETDRNKEEVTSSDIRPPWLANGETTIPPKFKEVTAHDKSNDLTTETGLEDKLITGEIEENSMLEKEIEKVIDKVLTKKISEVVQKEHQKEDRIDGELTLKIGHTL